MSTDQQVRKLAMAVYQRLLDGAPDGHVDMATVRDEIERELRARGDLVDDVIEELAALSARAADDELTKRADSRQTSMLDDGSDALDGVWRLGGGRRVRVRYARRDDYAARMALKSKNVSAVLAAHAADEDEYSKLLPYFETAATTVAEAVEAWRADKA